MAAGLATRARNSRMMNTNRPPWLQLSTRSPPINNPHSSSANAKRLNNKIPHCPQPVEPNSNFGNNPIRPECGCVSAGGQASSHIQKLPVKSHKTLRLSKSGNQETRRIDRLRMERRRFSSGRVEYIWRGNESNELTFQLINFALALSGQRNGRHCVHVKFNTKHMAGEFTNKTLTKPLTQKTWPRVNFPPAFFDCLPVENLASYLRSYMLALIWLMTLNNLTK